MVFSFGFKSDDIEDDDCQDEEMIDSGSLQNLEHDQNLKPVKWHTLEEMLHTLPSQISYTFHRISDDPPLRLPRRDLFDIRAQLLAETDVSDANSTTLVDVLTSDDIKPKLYEGGFKTWECSIDLARLLLRHSRSTLLDSHVIELGSGTAVPSCVLLHQLLQEHPLGAPSSISDPGRILILADYNEHVLTHASIVNLLLTFAISSPANDIDPGTLEAGYGDISINTELIDAFRHWLGHIRLQIFGISGPWIASFDEMVNMRIQGPKLILASETIYQPESIEPFVNVLLGLMTGKTSTEQQSQALVAAKKVYFGVGGGIDEFLSCLKQAGGSADLAWESGETGVGRAILSIRSFHNSEVKC